MVWVGIPDAERLISQISTGKCKIMTSVYSVFTRAFVVAI